MRTFSSIRLILSSLRHYWRTSSAVALGAATATAVLSGALLVGDSMRGSLASLTLDRLERIDDALITDRFFSADLADRLTETDAFRADFADAAPGLLVQATLERPASGKNNANSNSKAKAPTRLSRVTIIGADQRFWKLTRAPALPSELAVPGAGEIFLNQQSADELGAAPGDEVIIRVGQTGQIPPDSPLGRKTETLRSQRVRVARIVPNAGLGHFSLRPSQRAPRNAFVAARTLQTMLEQSDKFNALFVAGAEAARAPSESADQNLQRALRPTLADFGLRLDHSPLGHWLLLSDRMLLDKAVVDAAVEAYADYQPQLAVTYLANWITAPDPPATGQDGAPPRNAPTTSEPPTAARRRPARIAYSTVTALDLAAVPPLGPFLDLDSQPIPRLADDEIIVNRWTADDLEQQGRKLAIGDTIELTYFLPESTHGRVEEATARFRLRAIVQLDGPAADRSFTPELKGVTDQTSISRWDPPFPFDSDRVRSSPPNNQDDLYWKEFRATPKAFVSLAAGQRLWGSRFGNVTSVRFAAPPDASAERLAAMLHIEPAKLGFEFLPVKRLGLAAARGTTPFNVLFLGFSFFIVTAAVLLIAILYRLGLEQRASELGLLSAIGVSWPIIRRWQIGEGLIVAGGGAGLGLALGIGYARLMLAALQSPWFWRGAVNSTFLELHLTPTSLIIGFVSGLLVAAVVMWNTTRQMQRVSVRQLLAGVASTAPNLMSRRPTRYWVSAALAVAATLIGGYALRLGGEAQAGAFFGSGALMLAALLTLARSALRSNSASFAQPGGHPMLRLAARSAQRNPTRSALTIGLVAAACFLIVAISAFRLDPAALGHGRESGGGGFALIAETDQSIYQDLGDPKSRAELGFGDREQRDLAGVDILGFRVSAGDDASCLNLYQTSQPRVLGVPEALINRGGFAWAGSLAQTDEERANPWRLLDAEPANSGGASNVAEVDGGADPLAAPIPVVLDLNTALYSLHLGDAVSSPLGKRFTIDDGRGGKLTLRVVGLLTNSLFQGDLLIGEREFRRRFPAVNGYRLFLVESPQESISAARATLNRTLGDYGFEAIAVTEQLADFMQVQNTYLATFQSLGALGLLLGTLGLAAVQMRGVFERRSEFALMRAAGFTRGFLAMQLLAENAVLLLIGMAIGVAAAGVAIAPHLFGGGAGIPVAQLGLMLLTIAVGGVAAGSLAVRALLRTELLPALRGG